MIKTRRILRPKFLLFESTVEMEDNAYLEKEFAGYLNDSCCGSRVMLESYLVKFRVAKVPPDLIKLRAVSH